MKKMSFLLAALLLLSFAASCGSDSAPESTVNEREKSETASAETAEEVPEVPPLEKISLGGREMVGLIRTEWSYEFDIEAEDGDSVNDAIYRRNRAVEEEAECEISFVLKNGAWGAHEKFTQIIHASVLAADGEFDFIAGYQAVLPFNIAQGDLFDLASLPYLTLDGKWWSDKGMNALKINGRCYMAGGDIAVTMLEDIYCMFFNKRVAEEYNTDDFYELVRSRGWTHEKLLSLISGVSRDLDGDNEMKKEDFWGFATEDTYIRPYVVIYETPTLECGTDGIKCVWNTEHTANVVDKITAMKANPDIFAAPDREAIEKLFADGRVLLVPSRIGIAARMRAMEDDFGIIPYPLYDEKQSDYHTTTLNEITMMAIPLTAKDPSASAYLLEALCRASTDTVAHAFYDTALNGKYARDEESSEMLSLIRASVSFDTGWVNSVITGVSGYTYGQMFKSGKNEFSSWYAENESAIGEKLVKFAEAYYG